LFPEVQPGIAIAPPNPVRAWPWAPPAGNQPPGLPPDSRSPRACRNRQPTLQPGDEVSPSRRRRRSSQKAVFGLDKITGLIIFDEDIGETVQFGALRVKTDACYTPRDRGRNYRRFCRGR